MKAPAFDYVRPESLADALGLLSEHGQDARVLAGGQSLLAMMNLRLATPALLVDIGRVPGLRDIAREGDSLRIGAMATHSALMASSAVREQVPLLAMAVPHVAHAAIRNAGTIGGSLALADPAAEYPAVALALDAVFIVAGRGGERRVAAKDWFLGLYETALKSDEILVATLWPRRRADERFAFLELARRRGDYAMVGLAAAVGMRGDRVASARLAWLSVDDRPRLSEATAKALVGNALDDIGIGVACGALADELEPKTDPHADASTRRHLAGVLLGRALRAMAAQKVEQA